MPSSAKDVVVLTIPTEGLTRERRSAVIEVCIAAHDNENFRNFRNLFSYIPSGGRHFLVYEGPDLVSHAVVTTRWVQPEDQHELRTAFVDAVATKPSHQARGFASMAMRELAAGIDDYEIGCLQTDKPAFYERLGWEPGFDRASAEPLLGIAADLLATRSRRPGALRRPRESR